MGWRRPVWVVVVVCVMFVFTFYLLVSHSVVQPLALLLPSAALGGGLHGWEAPSQIQSPVVITSHPRIVTWNSTSASLPNTVGKGSKTKNNPPQDALKKNKQQEDPLKNMVVLSHWPPKVQFPLMAFTNPGRLGNRLNSYAISLTFQVRHRSSVTVATTRDTVQYLTTLLDPANLSLPIVENSLMQEAAKQKAKVGVGPDWKTSDFVTHLEPTFQRAEKEYLESGKQKVYALGGYPNRVWLLAGYHDIIRAAYRFREDLKQKAARFLEGVMQERGRRDITFVGFHIRRTDYTKVTQTYYKCVLPGPAYYHSAMDHYRATLHNPVFVVASDDKRYARLHLNRSKDVVFSDMKAPAEDMALLGSCNHSIMTVGSYGFWSSFLAGGQVVYPLINNCSVTPFVHPDTLGPRGYENFKAFDVDGGGPVHLRAGWRLLG